ncbi:unnamed protein product [Closterium sp. NIES-65]|nr:unnamed protein product [Closterium sp. NIES-65]
MIPPIISSDGEAAALAGQFHPDNTGAALASGAGVALGGGGGMGGKGGMGGMGGIAEIGGIGGAMRAAGGDDDMARAMESLIPALWQSFAVILIGYACVKLEVVKPQHKQGLSLFVTKLALPALLFSGMASLDFSKVNWSFLLAVTIGKTAVFFLALGITMLLDIGKPQVVGTGAVNGIFVSQSNDFALGLPIFQPIFGALHPEYIGYLYLVAPISLIFLNPLGFLLMESDRKGGPDGEEGEEEEDEDGEERVGGRGARDGREGEGDPWECCDLVPEGEEAALMALEKEEEQRDGVAGRERGGKGAMRTRSSSAALPPPSPFTAASPPKSLRSSLLSPSLLTLPPPPQASSLSHPPSTTLSLAPSPSTSHAPVYGSLALAPSPLSRVLPSPLGPPSPVAAAAGAGVSGGAGMTGGGAGVSGGGDGGGGGAVDLPQGWTRRAYTGKLAAGGGGGKSSDSKTGAAGGVCIARGLHVCVSVCVGVCVGVHVGVCVGVHVGVCVGVHVGVCVGVHVGVCVSACVSACVGVVSPLILASSLPSSLPPSSPAIHPFPQLPPFLDSLPPSSFVSLLSLIRHISSLLPPFLPVLTSLCWSRAYFSVPHPPPIVPPSAPHLLNPIRPQVPLGLAANYLFNHDIPPLLSGPFESFGAAFSPLSLFILGMSMADETEKASDEQTRLGPLLLSLALVAGKCLHSLILSSALPLQLAPSNYCLPPSCPVPRLPHGLSSPFSSSPHLLLSSSPPLLISSSPPLLLSSSPPLLLSSSPPPPMLCQRLVPPFFTPLAADDTSLSLAGLIYGSLPVTPATFFFACEYGLCQSYIGMATVLGTFLFGPLVYVLTQLAFLVMNHYEQLLEQVESSSRSMALVGGICALWTLLALLRLLLSCRPAPPAFPHATTTAAAQTAADSGALAAAAGTAIEGSATEGTGAAAAAAGVAEGGRAGSEQDPYELHRVVGQMLVCCIALCWTSASVASLLCRAPLPPLPSLLRYLFHTTGHLASAVFTALLALSELLCSALGPSLVHRLRFYLVFSGWMLAALPVVLPLVLSPGWPDIPALCPTDLISCWYPFGSLQFLAALIIYSIAVMIIITSLSLLIWEQYAGLRASGLPINWVVATRWRQKTDLDSQNALLLFCCYAVFSMLVSCTISIFALLNGGCLEGHLALLLLLMHVLLSYSQGAVLFLAFGMHAGLVLPLVAAREWWRKQRLSFLGEVSPFFVDEWQYLAPDDDYPMPGATHSNSMMLARGWSMNPAQLQLFPRDWDLYSRGWEDAMSVREDGMSVRDYYPSYPIDEGDEDTVVSADDGGDYQTDRDDAETVVEVTEDSVF